MGLLTKLQQAVRIKTGEAIDKSTTAVEKEKDSYDQLMAKLPTQRANVERVMAAATMAKKDYDAAVATVEKIKKDYQDAKSLGGSEELLNSLGTTFSEAQQTVLDRKANLDDATAASAEAHQALDATTKAIGAFGRQVENDQHKAELAGALRTTAEARQQAQAIDGELTQAGAAHRQVDLELETARAANNLSKGSSTEQELAALREKQASDSGRAALEAALGTTPPAAG